MKIGVLSDTHIHTPEELHPEIIMAFSSVDLIVHAGDFVGLAVLEGLRNMGEVKAVRGNVDSIRLRGLLLEKELLEVDSKRIGVIHGWGGPEGIERRIREKFNKVDAIIYGHSHQAQNRKLNGVLFFNPGPGRESFGILTIGKDIRGEIIMI
jgi:hypothetical protein